MPTKTLVILSTGYWFSAYTLGLLLHPYKTVRLLLRQASFRPILLVPTLFWILSWVIGFIGLRTGGFLLHLIGVISTPRWLIGTLAFIFWWFTDFLLLWQILLTYLTFRFSHTLNP